MIRSFKLSRYRLAKVWLDEAPHASFLASSTVVRMLQPTARLEASCGIAVIELLIPQGPKASYALIGGELIKSDAHDFEVFASVASDGMPYSASLASRVDEVTVGLPNEYADAVFKGAERIADTIGAPTKAALQFKWAAHGRVGSSPWIFEKASGLVLQLLVSPNDAIEQQIEAALDSPQA
jgi:hypothetical protein